MIKYKDGVLFIDTGWDDFVEYLWFVFTIMMINIFTYCIYNYLNKSDILKFLYVKYDLILSLIVGFSPS
jgi:hypothetical protein